MSTDKGKSTSAGSRTHTVSDSDTNSDDGGKQNQDTELETSPKQSVTKKETLPQQSLRYATRGKILPKEVQQAQDEILSLSIKKKRELYLCRNNYTVLDAIPKWPDYFTDDLSDDSGAQEWWKRNKGKVFSDIRPDLNAKISVFRGDITTLEIDAIVNAANESLLGGGGVDGAIHHAAGSKLLNECKLLRGCRAGEATITCGYRLPAKHVIHTVGPRGERPEVLEACYQMSLDLIKENELTTVAFPCVSTGIFGYPNLNAATVALKTIRNWLETEDYAEKVERIIFCLFLDRDVEIYNEQLQLYFPVERAESK